VRVLLYAPLLASPGITIARLPVPVLLCRRGSPIRPGRCQLGRSRSWWARRLAFVGELAIGPVLAGLPGAALAVLGVSVMVAPVPAAAVLPLTVGSVAETVTLVAGVGSGSVCHAHAPVRCPRSG